MGTLWVFTEARLWKGLPGQVSVRIAVGELSSGLLQLLLNRTRVRVLSGSPILCPTYTLPVSCILSPLYLPTKPTLCICNPFNEIETKSQIFISTINIHFSV